MAGKRGRRPTLSDVAQLAGVGPATVDRVLNERGNVSEEVRRKVIDAARALGLKRQLPPEYHPTIRLELILARPELPLLDRMATEFRRLARSSERTLSLHVTTLAEEDPDTLAQTMVATRCTAVAVYAQDHPVIRLAIARLWRRGVPVITIISDLPNSDRLAYAGTDHHAAGRTAGYFLSHMVPEGGPLVVLCNHLGFQSHAERVAGLREYLQDAAPHLTIARIVEGQDDRVRSRARLEAAFRDMPDIVGVYNVGAANLGVRAAIESGILPRRPVFIGHELTQHTEAMLRDGIMTLTLDQSPRLQAQFTLDVLMDHFGYEDVAVPRPYRSTVPIVLYGPEYLPARID